ncbi:MAG: SAM-dependent methyltransferase [Acidimicrobiales bacterium]
MNELAALVAERVGRRGPLPFDEVVDLALYHPERGFYGQGRGAGRRGDFITSPEVGRLFGAVLARALDQWWADLGRPDPYVVVEAGAGAGTLAAAVLAAAPACGPALRYVLVERSEVLRRAQATRLPVEPAASVLGPALGDDPDEGPRPHPGAGPLVGALADLPVGPFAGVVVANELLDNMPFRLLQRTGFGYRAPALANRTQNEMGGWEEVRVGEDLSEVLVPADPGLAAQGDRWAPDAAPGARIPVQHAAGAWLRAALACLRRGRVVVVDYADSTPSLAARPWTEWVRTYRGHGRGGHPLADLGEQDVTCEVAVDQLGGARPPAVDRSQAAFLQAFGIADLVSDARRIWHERAAIGDLAALAARSRVGEADALIDPAGLGAFRVLEWPVGRAGAGA